MTTQTASANYAARESRGEVKAQAAWKTFLFFTLRVIIAHTITYFLFGLLASNVFQYGRLFELPVIRDFMLPIDQHDVLTGPFLQPVRGLLFAVALWPLRGFLLERKRGWLILWGLLVVLGILSTPAAAPGSIEGMLYTRLPMWYHLIGLPEIVLQTLVFAVWLVWWERQSVKSPSEKKANPLLAEIVRAVMAACFAYIGYAIGGLILAGQANAAAAKAGTAGVDIQAAGANFKMQFMFVVAFLVNLLLAFWVGRRWQAGRKKLPLLFLLFWLVDALVPWLYQTLVFGSSYIPTAILLGLFPALILTACIALGNRKPRARGLDAQAEQ